MGWSLWGAYRRLARRTAQALGDAEDSVAETRRAMLWRGLVVIGIMTTGLAFTILLLENLVWTEWTDLP